MSYFSTVMRTPLLKKVLQWIKTVMLRVLTYPQVVLSGKPLSGNLGHLEMVFQWPYAVTNEKWLLYLLEIQMTGTSQPFCVPAGNIINPLNKTVSHWMYDCFLLHSGHKNERLCHIFTFIFQTSKWRSYNESDYRCPKFNLTSHYCVRKNIFSFLRT